MTSTAGSYDDGRSPLRRAAILLGHYAGQLVPATFVVIALYAVFRIWADTNIIVARVLFSYAFPVAMLLLFWAQRVHRKNMCLRDFDAPLLSDPQGQVDKHDARLRLYHTKLFERLPITAGIGFAAAQIVAAIVVTAPLWAKVVVTVVMLGGVAVLVYLSYVEVVHTRLRRWCKYCRRDDGDDDQAPAPAPDPVGHATR